MTRLVENVGDGHADADADADIEASGAEAGAGLPAALRSPGASLDDRAVIALAGAAWVGAWASHPLPIGVAVMAVGLALLMRRPWLLCLTAMLLASTLGARSWAGLAPAEAEVVSGRAVLVTDPDDAYGAARAVVRMDGRRLELSARGGAGGVLRSRLAGEEIDVSGRVRPPPPGAMWLAVRHVVGRMDADHIEPVGPGAPPWRLGNAIRRNLVEGAASMAPERRSLFTGFVFGDDRDQRPEVADDFQGAGLTHLLAVSGENVAFVLALSGPLLRRTQLGTRWFITLGVLAMFALITRFEPSVLRASAMAAVAVTASALGREAAGTRILALAVTGLVLVDPLLVHAVGFQLSVAASAGIIVLSPRLSTLMPGPAALREALGVTTAAQLGVAPVLVAVFDGVPVVSVAANLLVAPATGPVMMWGLTAGSVAGMAGEPLAGWLHIPTSWCVGWVALVARHASRLPLGDLRARELLLIVIGLALVAWGRNGWTAWRARAGTCLVVVALLIPAVVLRVDIPASVVVVEGAMLHRAGGASVLVLSSARIQPADLLAGLRRAGVRRLDLVAARGGGPATASLVAAIGHRWLPGHVIGPTGNEIPGADTPPAGTRLLIGGLTVVVRAVSPSLDVEVSPSATGSAVEGPEVGSEGAPRARSPPLRRDAPGRGDRHRVRLGAWRP